jgi:transcriptional regulator with XRE-family HTH domain
MSIANSPLEEELWLSLRSRNLESIQYVLAKILAVYPENPVVSVGEGYRKYVIVSLKDLSRISRDLRDDFLDQSTPPSPVRTDARSLGTFCKDLRRTLNYSQADMAKALGVSQPEVSKIENSGKYVRIPRSAVFFRNLSTMSGVPLEQILARYCKMDPAHRIYLRDPNFHKLLIFIQQKGVDVEDALFLLEETYGELTEEEMTFDPLTQLRRERLEAIDIGDHDEDYNDDDSDTGDTQHGLHRVRANSTAVPDHSCGGDGTPTG